MRIENNLHPYETVTQRTSLARMASKIWIYGIWKNSIFTQYLWRPFVFYSSLRWNVSSPTINVIFKCLSWFHFWGVGGGRLHTFSANIEKLVIYMSFITRYLHRYLHWRVFNLFLVSLQWKRYIERVFICHYTKEDMSQIDQKNAFWALQVANSHVDEVLKE